MSGKRGRESGCLFSSVLTLGTNSPTAIAVDAKGVEVPGYRTIAVMGPGSGAPAWCPSGRLDRGLLKG